MHSFAQTGFVNYFITVQMKIKLCFHLHKIKQSFIFSCTLMHLFAQTGFVNYFIYIVFMQLNETVSNVR